MRTRWIELATQLAAFLDDRVRNDDNHLWGSCKPISKHGWLEGGGGRAPPGVHNL